MSSYIKTKEENRRKQMKNYDEKLYDVSKAVFAAIVAASKSTNYREAAEKAVESSKELLKELKVPYDAGPKNDSND